MKVAHFAIATPGRCGLYETTRELVAGERALGVDARVVDPKPNAECGVTGEDRGVPIADMEWAVTADLIVSHSGHDGTPVAETDQPIVIAAHGRPISTWMMEREGGAPAYSYHAARSRLPRYRACVTFWPEFEPYFRSLWAGKPVHIVPAMVDCKRWSPGPTTYDFAGRAGRVNVVLTDPWARRDTCLLPAIHAFDLFRQSVEGARLHIYGIDGVRGLRGVKLMLGDSLGVVQGWAADLLPVYRAADLLVTPHRMYTRSIREAMACDVQVVTGRDCHSEDIEDVAATMLQRLETPVPSREWAVRYFNPERAARAMVEVIEQYARQEATV